MLKSAVIRSKPVRIPYDSTLSACLWNIPSNTIRNPQFGMSQKCMATCTALHQVGSLTSRNKTFSIHVFTNSVSKSLFCYCARKLKETSWYSLHKSGWKYWTEGWKVTVIRDHVPDVEPGYKQCIPRKRAPLDTLLCMPHAYLLQWNSICCYNNRMNIKSFESFNLNYIFITRVLFHNVSLKSYTY